MQPRKPIERLPVRPKPASQIRTGQSGRVRNARVCSHATEANARIFEPCLEAAYRLWQPHGPVVLGLRSLAVLRHPDSQKAPVPSAGRHGPGLSEAD